jgi:uncharacterized membrane protein
MEGFSDGVFGFAATLLVVSVALHPPGTPLQQVLHAWPAYLAYIISFLTIGGAWLLHTALSDRLAQTDPIFLRLNLLLLLVVAFVPFPTGLVADALHQTSGERVYVTLYGLTLLAIRILGSALDGYARHEHLYAPHGDDGELHSDQRKLLPVIIGYVIAILIGLAVPVAAVVLYFGIAVYAIVPFRGSRRAAVPALVNPAPPGARGWVHGFLSRGLGRRGTREAWSGGAGPFGRRAGDWLTSRRSPPRRRCPRPGVRGQRWWQVTGGGAGTMGPAAPRTVIT